MEERQPQSRRARLNTVSAWCFKTVLCSSLRAKGRAVSSHGTISMSSNIRRRSRSSAPAPPRPLMDALLQICRRPRSDQLPTFSFDAAGLDTPPRGLQRDHTGPPPPRDDGDDEAATKRFSLNHAGCLASFLEVTPWLNEAVRAPSRPLQASPGPHREGARGSFAGSFAPGRPPARTLPTRPRWASTRRWLTRGSFGSRAAPGSRKTGVHADAQSEMPPTITSSPASTRSAAIMKDRRSSADCWRTGRRGTPTISLT